MPAAGEASEFLIIFGQKLIKFHLKIRNNAKMPFSSIRGGHLPLLLEYAHVTLHLHKYFYHHK